jgi:hypothetical protein
METQMAYLIRAAFTAISLATITPVANAAPANNVPGAIQQDSQANWGNG